MSNYQYPYLSPHQTRTQEQTAWQQELANAIESIFSKGAHTAAYSAFEGTDDEEGVPATDWLRERKVDALDVVGIATDYCVRATALDGVRHGFATRVLLGLTEGVDPVTTREALGAMRDAGVALVGVPAVADG